jgi:hypothetical protein
VAALHAPKLQHNCSTFDLPIPAMLINPGMWCLQNVRVVQRNLVYVVGLAMELCHEDILKGPDYFGQFGKIVKVRFRVLSPCFLKYILFVSTSLSQFHVLATTHRSLSVGEDHMAQLPRRMGQLAAHTSHTSVQSMQSIASKLCMELYGKVWMEGFVLVHSLSWGGKACSVPVPCSVDVLDDCCLFS